MRLYLIQHGKAYSEMEDPERSLTDNGREETLCMATWLKDRNINVSRIWHSRKTRARETAEILSEYIGPVRLEEKDGLAPNDPVELMEARLIGSSEDIVIVGHLPFLSKLTSLLLLSDEKKNIVSFKNSGILCLEREDEWNISWYLTPHLTV